SDGDSQPVQRFRSSWTFDPMSIALRQILFTLFAVILPPFVYAYGFRPPREKALEEIRSDISKKQMQIAQGRAAARKLPIFREELHRLDYEIEQTVAKFPRYLSANR